MILIEFACALRLGGALNAGRENEISNLDSPSMKLKLLNFQLCDSLECVSVSV